MEIYSEYCQRYTLTTTQIWRMPSSVAVEADHHWGAATMQSVIFILKALFILCISTQLFTPGYTPEYMHIKQNGRHIKPYKMPIFKHVTYAYGTFSKR